MRRRLCGNPAAPCRAHPGGLRRGRYGRPEPGRRPARRVLDAGPDGGRSARRAGQGLGDRHGVTRRGPCDGRTPAGRAHPAEQEASTASPQAGTFFWTDAGGTGRTCSGAVVRSPGHDLVLSAGHCLKGYAGTSPQRHLAFVPQYHDTRKPFGVFPVRTDGVYVPQQYYDLGEHAGAAYDFAFAVTEPGQDGTRIQDAVGGVRLLTGTGYRHAPVRMIGYPAGTERPLECWSRTTRWDSDDPADPGTFSRSACDAFVGGTAGVPCSYPGPAAGPSSE
ncbi:trypsin-like serine peptidase [Streptomyces sp. NPDC052301]|uniref:trypsin-like serine peptidase n=1 Tax=Streptomyces sp. NPDC052301 TaxID=3365687 RepID=UPI0037D6E9BE